MGTKKFAKILRIITIPPVLVMLLIVAVCTCTNDIFTQGRDVVVALLGLGIFPVLAYPLQMLLFKGKEAGREIQRKLAFVFSLIGYTGCFVYGIFSNSVNLCVIFCTYFYSVVLLTVCNKCLPIRASGHACSSFAPVILSGYYIQIAMGIPFLALFMGSVWSSLYLKRHKPADIVAGSASFVIAFVLAVLTVPLYS